MSDYTFSVLRELSEEELFELESQCRAELKVLLERYFSQYKLPEGFPSSAGNFDLVRGAWLLDEREDRPEYSTVVRSIGFEFGRFLAHTYGFSWSWIKDPYGEQVSMTRQGETHDPISIPPFVFVAKRKTTQNVEVFKHFFEQVPPEFLGDSAH